MSSPKIHPGSAPKIIAFTLGIMFVLFSGIGLMANMIHRHDINEYEELGKIYSGPVTDNYFFEVPNMGTKSTTRVEHMICFKPENPPENRDLICSAEFVSKSLAKKYPVGSQISAYYRDDIFDSLLIPAIENWRNDWRLQYMPLGFLILGTIGIALGIIFGRKQA